MHCAVQIGQLFKIFQILGTPTENTWQGVEGMPCWQAQFPQWHARDLAEVRMSAEPMSPTSAYADRLTHLAQVFRM